MASKEIFKRLGKYELIEEIGRGGFAVVYKAQDMTQDRLVALKVLAPHLTWEPAFVQQFYREAKATAKLRHPNIVVVYEIGQDEGQLYLVMEYLVGRTLAQMMVNDKPLPLARIVVILEQVAAALDYAHGQSILHRDTKPANIMVSGQSWANLHVTLLDFGLVKAMESSQYIRSSMPIVGTPEYISPEQAEGRDIDYRADLYALGVVAYQMCTGRIPFQATSPLVLLRLHADKVPPPPRELNPSLPMAIEQVLLKALAKQPEHRFQSAEEMVQAWRTAMTAGGKIESPGLSRPADKKSSSAPGEPRKVPAPQPRRRWPVALSGVGLFFLVLLVVILVGLGSLDRWNFQIEPTIDAGALVASTTPTPLPAIPTATATETPLPPTPTPMPPTPTITATSSPILITKSKLEVRTGPGLQYDLLGLLPAGVEVTIIGRDENRQWWQIRFSSDSNGVGWVASDPEFSTSANAEQVRVALIPPTPTDTPTPTPIPATHTPTATLIPPTPTATLIPPTPTTIPHIEFNVSPISIQGGECVNITWTVSGVREIYFEGQGVGGSANVTDCPTESKTYNFRVVKQDGTEYREDIVVEVTNPIVLSDGKTQILDKQTIDFDRGIIQGPNGPGADFYWDGQLKRFSPQNGANGASLSHSFDEITLSDCQSAAYDQSIRFEGSSPIAGCFRTNEGRVGKFSILEWDAAGKATIQWLTWN